MSKYQDFSQLHHQSKAFLLANAWNPESAKIFEQTGSKAIATSSAALANAFGYTDGENIPFNELLFIAERIVKSVTIPVSVDMEGGYGTTAEEVFENIAKLHDAGVVGCNIEDSLAAGKRGIIQADEFARKIEGIKTLLTKKKMQFFINVRTDGFLLKLPNALEVTLDRVTKYENAGADGLFTPCITEENDIAAVVAAIKIPVNVMCMPGLPDFKTLSALGVKRISMGGFLHNSLYKQLVVSLDKINQDQSFASLF